MRTPRWGHVAAAACAAVLLGGCTHQAELASQPLAQAEVPALESSPAPATTPPRPDDADAADAVGTTAQVTGIVDGDTIATTSGRIRVIGIDTPEAGECGYDEATDNAARVVPIGASVILVAASGKDDTDHYGRLLRYVVAADGTDLGLAQISAGFAIARYDSRDGYGWHPNEEQYIAADAASPPVGCAAPQTAAPDVTGNPGLPPGPGPGQDLDCREIEGPVWVGTDDWHRLDGDGDGIGCE